MWHRRHMNCHLSYYTWVHAWLHKLVSPLKLAEKKILTPGLFFRSLYCFTLNSVSVSSKTAQKIPWRRQIHLKWSEDKQILSPTISTIKERRKSWGKCNQGTWFSTGSAVPLPSVLPFSDSYLLVNLACTDGPGIGVVCEGFLCFVGGSGSAVTAVVVCSSKWWLGVDEVREACTLTLATNFTEFFWCAAGKNWVFWGTVIWNVNAGVDCAVVMLDVPRISCWFCKSFLCSH